MNKTDPPPNGIAVIDKPAGWTSHDVVAKSRGILGTRKVGHSGTLDPDATGVLVLGVGKSTRLLKYLTGLSKRYTGQIVLGVETSTLDAAGEITATHDMAGVTLEQVEAAAQKFIGAIEQIPPMVSAIKIGGRRLHEIAREGGEVERPPRPVTVYHFEIAATEDPLIFSCDVSCSSGTYIRTLAADVGTALGGGAHLTGLRRLAVGSFTIDEAHPLEKPVLLSAATALRDFSSVTVSEEIAQAVAHGKVLDLDLLGVDGDGPWGVLNTEGELLAVYEPHKGRAKPSVVLVG